MNAKYRFVAVLFTVAVMLIMSVACSEQEQNSWQYGYREIPIPESALRLGWESVEDMYNDRQITTVMVVYTSTPLDQRKIVSETGAVEYYYTLTECTVLDVIKNDTARNLRPGETVILGQDLYLRDIDTDDGGAETVLLRLEPDIYPLDVGKPYLLFCFTDDTFSLIDEYLYWPGSYGVYDVSSREMTGKEIGAMTASPDSYTGTIEEYTWSREEMTSKKSQVERHADFSSLFEKYEGQSFE